MAYWKLRRLEQGFVLPFCSMMIIVLIGIVAYVADLGRALAEQRRAQFAVDSAAMAAAALLDPGASDSEISAEAVALAGSNGLPASEINVIECGVWNNSGKVFAPCGSDCSGCSDGSVNAVRVSGNKTVVTAFARVINVSKLRPFAQSVAVKRKVFVGECIRPFALAAPHYGGVAVETIFIVGNQAPGNWGKVDIGEGQQSGSPWFEEAMLTENCNVTVQKGDSVKVATGVGGLSRVFDELAAAGKEQIVVPIMEEEFPNGGSATMTVKEFVRLKFISQSGKGTHWEGTFEMLERDVDPLNGGSGFEDSVVLVQ